MSWDGIYRPKTHHHTLVNGCKVITCKRRFVKASTLDPKKVNCFACLVKLGVIPR